MWKQKWVIVLCIASGFAGMLQQWQRANAAVIPNACTQWQCKNITYLWDGTQVGNVGIVKLFAAAGSNPPNIALVGITNIFATASSNKLPLGNQFAVDLWTYSSCVPQCGQDKNNVWQIPQEVSPAGPPSKNAFQKGIMMQPCSDTGGVPGPPVANPVNDNPDKQSPPGWNN